MKYIFKTTEPDALAKFKAQANEDWQPSYGDLRGQYKQQLHHHLITEQGHICCYCGERIVQVDSHIEHFQPQKKYRHLELDYFNLLASCQQEIPKKHPMHCGKDKDDWFDDKLLVSPLIDDCADFFEYTDIGEILPTCRIEKAAAATETIDKLSLNIPKLQAGREGVINSFYDEPDFLSTLSDSEIDKLIHYYSCTDEKGQHQPYCQVIIYLLKQEKMYSNRRGD